jgi:predicted anti-sigma-YlaC factor YlaD
MPNDHVPTEWLAEYSKGVLQEPRLGQVEEHLLVCESCREQLNQFDDSWGLNG